MSRYSSWADEDNVTAFLTIFYCNNYNLILFILQQKWPHWPEMSNY